MRILRANGVFHDAAAALVPGGRTVPAADEERFTRRRPAPEPVHALHAPGAAGVAGADSDVVHVDGTVRMRTVDRNDEPLVARLLGAFERRTGVPVVVNTSLNTVGRPMVDDPRDALECFGSAPVDALVLGPSSLRRAALAEAVAA